MPDTFTWFASAGSTENHEYRRVVTRFEDYAQYTPRGVRPVRRNFTLQFSRRHGDNIEEIMDFLDTRKGVTPFDFPHPRTGEMISVVSEEPSTTYVTGALETLRVTFREN
jgi:phage-related protein